MAEPDASAAEPPRCPRCGAPMAPEQDWCLECGAAATTRVVRPPGWRLPLIVGLAVLALLGAALAIAVGSLSDKADRAAGGSARAAATAPASTSRSPRTEVARTAPRRTTTAPVPGAAEAGAVPVWPAGRQAYTVVAPSGDGRAGAERVARRLIAGGASAGILATDGYEFFAPGKWVVWVGRYPDRPAAQARVGSVARSAPGAYVTLIRRRGGQPTG